MKYLRKIYFMLLLLFIFPNIIYAQIEQNIHILLLRSRFIENYLFIELYIQNRTLETIYVLKDYYIDEIIDNNEYLKLTIESSKLNSFIGYDDNGELEWISSAIWHEPNMVEIRSNQNSYLTLLLNIPNNFTEINRNNKINEIIGIKYSIQEYRYILKPELWEEDLFLFINDIRQSFYDIQYRRRVNLLWFEPIN